MIRRSIARAVSSPATRPVNGAIESNFNQLIKSLFANNEQGFAYDPNDLTTMFQDAAGTAPVTGTGQPVGLMLDKSGRGNHAYQTTSASRPILRQNAITGAYYLEFDGSDDFLVTNSIDFSATDKVSLFAGVAKLSTTVRILCELSADMNVNVCSFYLAAPENSNGNYGFKSRGNATQNSAMTALSSTANANDVAVISAYGDISGDINKIRRNAVETSATTELGVGNYGNYPLYIGRRGGTTFPFKGHLYGLIGIGRLTTGDETTAIETELAERVGVTLSV